MKSILNWKKEILKSNYDIFSHDIHVGKLKVNSIALLADGVFNGKQYHFKSKGFFKQETHIIDSGNSTIGKITYNKWLTNAKVEYSGKIFYWIYDDGWNTKWRLYEPDGIQIDYNGSFTKGKIEYDFLDNMLVLTGLFIKSYYMQTATYFYNSL